MSMEGVYAGASVGSCHIAEESPYGTSTCSGNDVVAVSVDVHGH